MYDPFTAGSSRIFTCERSATQENCTVRTWQRARWAVNLEVAVTSLVRTLYDLRHAVVSTWLPHVGLAQARGRTAAEQDGRPLAYRSGGPLLSIPSVRS